ncbi:hypothetical protein GFB49_11505 [Epibacterium sp. SM1979]|uniref:DNA binding HTH domain-containing protein n=1 Tax=Tritonibacter litoralis TaxID=2662264 RepID=A0A843YII6_9RHOB|nr:helix-turn-helix domain-containing protein [Tritonibacter litoralis]MQQ09082.1 hypothetical protein [Tritonibacter litoralis]
MGKQSKICISEGGEIHLCQDCQTLPQVIMEVERIYLEYVLTQAGGNRTKAAELAGLSNTTLRDKLARYTVKTKVSLS